MSPDLFDAFLSDEAKIALKDLEKQGVKSDFGGEDPDMDKQYRVFAAYTNKEGVQNINHQGVYTVPQFIMNYNIDKRFNTLLFREEMPSLRWPEGFKWA